MKDSRRENTLFLGLIMDEWISVPRFGYLWTMPDTTSCYLIETLGLTTSPGLPPDFSVFDHVGIVHFQE